MDLDIQSNTSGTTNLGTLSVVTVIVLGWEGGVERVLVLIEICFKRVSDVMCIESFFFFVNHIYQYSRVSNKGESWDISSSPLVHQNWNKI